MESKDIASLAVLAGEELLKSGAETYRVEETMERIALACGAKRAESLVLHTGLVLEVEAADGQCVTRICRVGARSIHLDRIHKVNAVARRLEEGRTTPPQAAALLQRIAREHRAVPVWLLACAAGLVGGPTVLLLGGTLEEGAAAFFVAAGMRWLLSWLTKYHAAPFTLDLVGAMVVAFLGAWLGRAWEELSRDLIIVGGLMPLVPGVAITYALRDLLAGDLMSGAARILEAALTAVAVAMGVILVLALPMRMGG